MPVQGRRVNQRDIARITGVSQAAVSMVVSGKADEGGIAKATQEKVRTAMRELGYVAHAAGRALRGGRNGLIGVHTFEPVFPVAVSDYYHAFLRGIEEAAVEAGHDLVLFASTQQADGSRTIYGDGSNRLRLADGAVILGLQGNDEELERLSAEGYPFVFIGRRQVVGAPYVTADYAQATVDVAGRLAELGHHRIRYVGSDVRSGPQQERLNAFVAHRGGTEADRLAPVLRPSFELDADWLASERDAGTTALVLESQETAEAVARVVAASGLSVPGDMSAVCLDMPLEGGVSSDWSHITVPRRDMGARAVHLLLGLLSGELAPERHEVLACPPASSRTLAPPARRRP